MEYDWKGLLGLAKNGMIILSKIIKTRAYDPNYARYWKAVRARKGVN